MDEVPTIGDELLSPLVKRVHGEVLTPGDERYDDARTIWNSRLQREPALVVRCADADDVIAAVELARDQGLPLAVRGGGHDYAGRSSCDGSVLVDLSPMNRVEIDPEGTGLHGVRNTALSFGDLHHVAATLAGSQRLRPGC